jgi:hypothetical protein
VPRCGDRTVLSIAAHCPQFSSLLATHVSRLTNDPLLTLVRGCTHLTKVASGSAMAADITDLGLVALAECGLACLRSLCLWCSLDVTDATQQLLRERCPLYTTGSDAESGELVNDTNGLLWPEGVQHTMRLCLTC